LLVGQAPGSTVELESLDVEELDQRCDLVGAVLDREVARWRE